MPRTRSLAWAELKFGLISVFAIVMAALLIFAVGGGGGFFWQNYSLKVRFPNVAGLMNGSPVRVSGLEVGTVTSVQLLPTGAEVEFTVRDDARTLVTDQSTAVLGSISLLGESAVDITPAPNGQPLPEGSYIKVGVAEGSLAQLTSDANATMVEARGLVQDIRSGKGTIGKLFTDEAVYNEFDALMKSAERVVASVNSGKGSAGRLINDPKVYNELEASVANLNAITTKLKNGEGSLGQLLNDPAIARSLTATSTNLETMTSRLNKGEGTAGKLLTDDALYKRIDGIAARLDTVLQQLNDGQGTAGRLLQDKQLYENMNQTVTEMKNLIAEIKKDPKKYLNVKVSIF